jgi:hypothetical protein
VVAKDGWTLPTPHFEDTVLVAPGERIDVIVEATEVGVWAFHCHVLTHAEGPDGMFGMVTALVVQAAAAAAATRAGSSAVATAARSAGSTAFACTIPGVV